MWELDHKEAECQRIDAFKLWCWRRLLRVLWTARRSNKSILKKINPEYSFNLGSVPGLGRSPGEGHGNQLQYSCLENSMDRGAWWAIVYRAARSQTQLSDSHIYSFERLLLKLMLQYFAHLMWRANSLEKTLMLGKIEGNRVREWKRIRWLDLHV